MLRDVHVNLNPGLPWQKAAFNKRKTLVTSKLDFNLSKKLVNFYIWDIAV